MTNPSTTHDSLIQNGYVTDNQDMAEAAFSPSRDRSPATQTIAPSASGDWSSLTQDLINTLPRVWSRGLLYLLVIFVSVALPWVMLAKVDQTGSAKGRLEPKGKTLKLDAPVAGTVSAVKVKEGQTVKAGQVLLEFESNLTQAELQQVQAKLEGQQNRRVQLELIKNQLESTVRTQQLQSQAQESEQLAQLDQTRRRLNSSQKVATLEASRLAVAKNDVERHRYLWQEQVISKSKLEEIEGISTERQKLLEQAQSEIQQSQTELEKQQKAYQRIINTGRLAVLESQKQLKELQSQVNDLDSDIVQTGKQMQALQFQLKQRILRAPTDGTIFQLAVDHAGTVLQPGQPIAQIALQGVPLVLRAQMPGKESGFLKIGMPVKLKFDAYPFQDYGVVTGRLQWISPDAKVVETPQGKVETYELEIVLEQSTIQVNNKRIPLAPGQPAIAEVIVRQRRISDLLLDPFKKLQKDGLDL